MASQPIYPERPKKWRKILYEDQGVPDNYVDETFLIELKKNLHTRTYAFWSVVLESENVIQQVSIVCMFVVIFIYMDSDAISNALLFLLSSSMTLIGYIINLSLSDDVKLRIDDDDKKSVSMMITFSKLLDDVKSTLVFLTFGFGLSPILMTLTKTISTDTIYAMATLMLVANVVFHDYGITDGTMVPRALSLNAAFFASVCLASRLSTSWHAFVMVTLTVEIFALWPILQRKLHRTWPPYVQVALTVVLGMTSLVGLATVSTFAATVLFLVDLFVLFACPAWLIRLQRYKNNIYGPWDEAVITD